MDPYFSSNQPPHHGLVGWYHRLRGLWFSAVSGWSGPAYKPFWDAVRELDIPVFLKFESGGNAREKWNSFLTDLEGWKNDYYTIPCVLPQAFPFSTRVYDDEITITDCAVRTIRDGNIYVELAFPILRGGVEDYPYPVCQQQVQRLYDTFGATKLVWGSDAPNVERYCTYAQCLNYLKNYCTFIPPQGMELILGKNIEKVFRLKRGL